MNSMQHKVLLEVWHINSSPGTLWCLNEMFFMQDVCAATRLFANGKDIKKKKLKQIMTILLGEATYELSSGMLIIRYQRKR